MSRRTRTRPWLSAPAVLVLPGGGLRERTEHDGTGCARRLHGLGLADGVRWGAHGGLALPHTERWTAACRRRLELIGVLPAGGGA
ncbi:hypothetical protein [Kineococcus sp. SYSU DK005]|uniref:hypothetical protein n=1 Tax=Kineococcus sp. SYSU DK005 TaxID=3383126 RepID=UPI003D7D6CB8